MDWILFTSQLPVSPSSLRVMVWRRMKAVGAVGLQNGVWVLPHTTEHEQFIRDLMRYVEEQGGGCQSFTAAPLTQPTEDDLLNRIQAQRGEEYAELSEHCQAMLKELDKESRGQKFTFAELEENEAELEKLTNWLAKINSRDPIKGKQAENAEQLVETCRAALKVFSGKVYTQDKLASGDQIE